MKYSLTQNLDKCKLFYYIFQKIAIFSEKIVLNDLKTDFTCFIGVRNPSYNVSGEPLLQCERVSSSGLETLQLEPRVTLNQHAMIKSI